MGGIERRLGKLERLAVSRHEGIAGVRAAWKRTSGPWRTSIEREPVFRRCPTPHRTARRTRSFS